MSETPTYLYRRRRPALRLQGMQQHRRARQALQDDTHRSFVPGECEAWYDLKHAEQPKVHDKQIDRQQSPDPESSLRHQLGTRAILGRASEANPT